MERQRKDTDSKTLWGNMPYLVQVACLTPFTVCLLFLCLFIYHRFNLEDNQRREPLLKKIERLSPGSTPPQIPDGEKVWSDPRSFENYDSTWLTSSYRLRIKEYRKRVFFKDAWKDVVLRVSNAGRNFDGKGGVDSANRLDIFSDDVLTSNVRLDVQRFDNWSSLKLHSPFFEVGNPFDQNSIYTYGEKEPLARFQNHYYAIYDDATSWAKILIPLFRQEPDEGKYDDPLTAKARRDIESYFPSETSHAMCLLLFDREGILDTYYPDLPSDFDPVQHFRREVMPKLWIENTPAVMEDTSRDISSISAVEGLTTSTAVNFNVSIRDPGRGYHGIKPFQITGRIEANRFKDVIVDMSAPFVPVDFP